MEIKVKGMQRVLKAIGDLAMKAPECSKAAMFVEGLHVMRLSQRLVPVDQGRLRASGYVQKPDARGRVEIGYATEYALAQHEGLDFAHTTGQAKYLEAAIDSTRGGRADRVAATAERFRKAGIRLSSPYPGSAEDGYSKGLAHDRSKKK